MRAACALQIAAPTQTARGSSTARLCKAAAARAIRWLTRARTQDPDLANLVRVARADLATFASAIFATPRAVWTAIAPVARAANPPARWVLVTARTPPKYVIVTTQARVTQAVRVTSTALALTAPAIPPRPATLIAVATPSAWLASAT